MRPIDAVQSRGEVNRMDDLISRQDAIEALAKFVPYAICDESTESYTNGLTDAYNLICQLPSAQPVQWIPCSERLPEDDREVLAVSDGCVLIANWQGEWIKYIELEDDYTILEPVNINVQYWMELPEPPEVE